MRALDKAKERQTKALEQQANAHYDAEVNKGSLSITFFKSTLNTRWENGWKLSHIFEQDGNTVIVWERWEG